MPNRLSKILSRSSKEKEAEAEAERNKDSSSNSSPPPGYAQAPPDYDAENRLDPPDVTAGFAKLNLSTGTKDTPQVDQCIAHLKVLESFYRLRQKVGSQDGLFGIDNSIVLDKGLPADNKTGEVLSKLSEKRWAIYVSRAVDRFAAWAAAVAPSRQMMTIDAFAVHGQAGTLCNPNEKAAPLRLDKTNMPPADVIMVWHAYMLNPRAYLEDCLRLGRMSLWHTVFPWQGVVDCINSETFDNEVSDDTKQNFTSLTELPWNQLDDLHAKKIECPRCKKSVECDYTTVPEIASLRMGKYSDWESLSRAVDDVLSSGTGFCDKDFETTCASCNFGVTHETLAAGKFCADVKSLLDHGVPMGGTILGYEGLPWSFGKQMDTMFTYVRETPFMNMFLRFGLGEQIAAQFIEPFGASSSMSKIRSQIEQQLANRKYLRVVKGSASGRMLKADRVSIRKCMSRYWDNSSPFALDLVGAVIRQGSFVEKMHNIDWIHSPALPSTMKRLLVKYQRFVSIMKDKNNMAVPTLDVDLAWHTHQLTPYNYMLYTVNTTGQFIDHDDKVAETALNDAFAWTSKTYQKLYNEPYSECTCWYCEAIRESTTNTASRLFNTKNSQVNDQLHNAEQDPRKSVHISTHNMVRPEDTSYKVSAHLKAEQLEKAYEKACERARKKGRKEPKRDDYYWSDAYGHPVYIPAYSPYIGYVGFMPMYYGVSPACMAVGAGAAGNCCAGTCGGGVAAGACGGSGGGCAGGVAGGCGGGGLAGGCGGGGGGGGGGGCGGGGGGGGCGGGGGG